MNRPKVLIVILEKGHPNINAEDWQPSLDIMFAWSINQAKRILAANPDIRIVFLDSGDLESADREEARRDFVKDFSGKTFMISVNNPRPVKTKWLPEGFMGSSSWHCLPSKASDLIADQNRVLRGGCFSELMAAINAISKLNVTTGMVEGWRMLKRQEQLHKPQSNG